MDDLKMEQLQNEVATLHRKMKYFERLLDVNLLSLDLDSIGLQTSVKGKCHSNYNKSDLAQLFFIMMEEEILFFDRQNTTNNRGLLQQFIINNFTYLGYEGSQMPIRTVSKQFSESKGFTYRAKHLKFLDKILEVLKERRERIARV